jgi:hypothetical protein
MSADSNLILFSRDWFSDMVKKKIDSRVRVLIENAVATRQRSLFVIVGDRGKDQVVNLHYMLSKAAVKARPSVLWCYKKELGFTTFDRSCASSLFQPPQEEDEGHQEEDEAGLD